MTAHTADAVGSGAEPQPPPPAKPGPATARTAGFAPSAAEPQPEQATGATGSVPAEAAPPDKTAARRLVAGGSILALALVVTNAGNYLLNLMLGRWLTPAQFSDANLMGTLMLTFTSVALCLELVSARFIGIRDAAGRFGDSERLAVSLRRWALGVGLLIGVVLAAASPVWRQLFNTGSAWPFVILAAGMPFYLQASVGRGVMQGRLRFGPLAITFLIEMVVRLSVGSGLVVAGLGVEGATAGLALSLVAAWAAVLVLRGGPERGLGAPPGSAEASRPDRGASLRRVRLGAAGGPDRDQQR
jgi:O-antigen/teichoic acid export membrane protein